MSNWDLILKEYPKAYAELGAYRGYPPPCNMSKYECSDVFEGKRLLYDFFDKNEIYVEISIDKTLEAKYCYEISTEQEFEWNCSGYSDLFYTRTEAEEEAFTKAFEILNDLLDED